MKYLLYSIFRSPDGEAPAFSSSDQLSGIDHSPLRIVRADSGEGHLCGLVTEHSARISAPTVENLISYHQVIESCFHRQALIPLRFGAWFDDQAQLQRFIASRAEEWQAILDEFAGCAEMSLRFLLPLESLTDTHSTTEEPSPEGTVVNSGRAWLASRRRHYELTDALSEAQSAQIETILRQIQVSFGQIIRRQKKEITFVGADTLLSIHLLIERAEIEHLRALVSPTIFPAARNLSLTGPFSPWNFVTPDPARRSGSF